MGVVCTVQCIHALSLSLEFIVFTVITVSLMVFQLNTAIFFSVSKLRNVVFNTTNHGGTDVYSLLYSSII